MKLVGLCTLILLSRALLAQTGPKELKLSGEIELFGASGAFSTTHRTRDRFQRYSGTAEYGDWKLRVSKWEYIFCNWSELDDTHLSYSNGGLSAKAGRFRIPFGPSTWYDQWYSGLIFVPLIELEAYGGRRLLERTSVGATADYSTGNHGFSVALTGESNDEERLTPRKANRLTVRTTYYTDGLTIGASGFADTAKFGKAEQMVGVDARFTVPQWVVRGTYLLHKDRSSKTKGFFVEGSHRPKGWTDVTFVGRFEGMKNSAAGQEAWTIGSKIQMPFDVVFSANYTGGPDMNRILLGGNFAFQLQKTVRF